MYPIAAVKLGNLTLLFAEFLVFLQICEPISARLRSGTLVAVSSESVKTSRHLGQSILVKCRAWETTSLALKPSRFVLLTLLVLLLFLTGPFFLYQVIRMTHQISINYNEGWNAFHTYYLMQGKPLYGPLDALPIIPVDYTPLSFLIIAALSFFTGDIVLTGRIIALVSFLVTTALIYKTVQQLTENSLASATGAAVWIAVVVKFNGDYIAIYDPHMLAQVFSMTAFYLFCKWHLTLNWRRACLLSLLCVLAVFTKQTLIAVPLTIALVLIFLDRRQFLFFCLAGFLLSIILTSGAWYHAGEQFFFNMATMIPPTSTARLLTVLRRVFLNNLLLILFLFPAFLFLRRERVFVPILIYFGLSFLLGALALRGAATTLNHLFDFFIASALTIGLHANNLSRWLEVQRTDFRIYSAIWRRLLIGLGCSLIVTGVLFNEITVAQYLSSDGVLERSTVATLRIGEITLIMVGSVLVLRRRQLSTLLEVVSSFNLTRFILGSSVLGTVLLPITVSIGKDVRHVLNYESIREKAKTYQEDVELLRSLPGPALFEEPLVGYHAGKEFLFDPLLGSQLMLFRRLPEETLIARIREKYFGSILLTFDIEQRMKQRKLGFAEENTPARTLSPFWTDNTLRAIRNHYVPYESQQPRTYHFYLPRRN